MKLKNCLSMERDGFQAIQALKELQVSSVVDLGCGEGILLTLEYSINWDNKYNVSHPNGRKVIFLGDLVDRGPNTPEVLKLVMDMTEAGIALCVPGNHDIKLMRKLRGLDVKVAHGMQDSLQQLEHETKEFIQRVIEFNDDRATT